MKSTLWPDASGDQRLSEHQKEKIKVATSQPVGILCGSPGSGKTFSAAAVVRKVIEQYGLESIAIAGPTGKASVRLSQSMAAAGVSNIVATTIHRLLKIGRNGHDGDGWGFQHNRNNPLPYRFLLIDESSMIDTDLMAALTDACADGTHVLFLGDTAQLAPVGHGAPLRDMIAGGVPCGELTEIRRNAGQIVHACVAIKAGKKFETAERYDPSQGHNLRMIETATEQETLEVVEQILQGIKTFHPVWQTQVLVGVNDRGNLNRQAVNDRLHALLNAEGRAATGNPFKVGDKIICLKNGSYVAVWPEVPSGFANPADLEDAKFYTTSRPAGAAIDPEQEVDPDEIDDRQPAAKGPAVEVYIANGEIGRVVAVADRLTIARIGEGDLLIKIPMGKPRAGACGDDEQSAAGGDSAGGETTSKGRGCNFDLAYAISVHKSQGSESPCVIVLADPAASRVADRAWYYTAVSRASKLCILIGSKSVIDRQRARQSLIKRKTFLKEILCGQ